MSTCKVPRMDIGMVICPVCQGVDFKKHTLEHTTGNAFECTSCSFILEFRISPKEVRQKSTSLSKKR